MLFNSFIFLLFLVIVIVVLFLIRPEAVNIRFLWLVGISFFFYAFGNVHYLPLLCGSILFNYLAGYLISASADEHGSRSNRFMWIGIAGNLALLGYFKYANFFIVNINAVTGRSLQLQHLILPLAISFFTFTQIAFLVDVKRGRINVPNFLSYSVFVAFFPYLLSGPITRYEEISPQFGEEIRKRIEWGNIYAGLFLFAIGLFKKTVVADTLSLWTVIGFSNATKLAFGTAWLTSLSYTFQIYFDFSGYTDMAIGIARMMNIRLPMNFNGPYLARNLQEFWRRWHMTLSRFLRDYIYIPMGGSRQGGLLVYRNLMITLLLAGFWHGAGWNFIIWGCLHGAGLCVNHLWHRLNISLHRYLSWSLTFVFVNIAWVFFGAGSVSDALIIIYAMANPHTVWAESFSMFSLNYSALLIVPLLSFVLYEGFISNSMILVERLRPTLRWTTAITLMLGTAMIFMLNNRAAEFLYFRF